MSLALGLVETKGLIGAIVAADAMAKAANITLIGREIVKPALVTIKIMGETAAVKHAVDIGAQAAKSVGDVVSVHVIPHPDIQINTIIPQLSDNGEGLSSNSAEHYSNSETKIDSSPEIVNEAFSPDEESINSKDVSQITVSETEIDIDSEDENLTETTYKSYLDEPSSEVINTDYSNESASENIEQESVLDKAEEQKLPEYLPDSTSSFVVKEEIATTDDSNEIAIEEKIQKKGKKPGRLKKITQPESLFDFDEEPTLQLSEDYLNQSDIKIIEPQDNIINESGREESNQESSEIIRNEFPDGVDKENDTESKNEVVVEKVLDEAAVKSESHTEIDKVSESEPIEAFEDLQIAETSVIIKEEEQKFTEESIDSFQENNQVSENGKEGNLQDKNVHELRRLARTIENFPIKGREISKANRNVLLEFFWQLNIR